MYRLLIVDDEEIITDGLYEVFNRLIPDKLDVCKAYSAKEALEWLTRTRIDLVLTDISMPGKSGLELSEEIRRFWPRCKIIFLTGYSEFDYAYKALQLPNARYLLKTEGYERIIETVKDAIEEIEQGNLMNGLLEQSLQQRQAIETAAQGDYLRHLLQDSVSLCQDPGALSRDFHKLKLSFDPELPVILILGQPAFPDTASFLDRNELLASAHLVAGSFLSELAGCAVIADRYGDWLWFVQTERITDDNNRESLLRYLEGTLELIQEACDRTLGVPLSFTVSGSPSAWTAITDQHERLRQLQQIRTGDGIPIVLVDRLNPEESVEEKEGKRLNQRVDNLTAHLETGRQERFMDTFYEIVRSIHPNQSIEVAAEMYYTVAIVLLSYVNRWRLHNQIEDYAKLMRLDAHASMKEGIRHLEKVAARIFEVKRFDEKEHSSNVIAHICEYIQNHLGEDLSLVRLAELHYFNPSYLSRLFKQAQGINLSEYIDNCRAGKAKELLRESNLKIREVALIVGYEAAHSFTRFFKKTTGMTPQEYRDSLYKKSGV
ncbi:response regulator [Paenibacillus sp. CN-4]|uniref:response regulator n=1 Tax=Paenibacillus nanchangensis TaxID=3348343 RepID=UPI00397BD1E4